MKYYVSVVYIRRIKEKSGNKKNRVCVLTKVRVRATDAGAQISMENREMLEMVVSKSAMNVGTPVLFARGL